MKRSIDIGLEILCRLARPGETLSQQQIADVCDCSRSMIKEIENKALKKVKRNIDKKGFKSCDLID